MTPTYLSVRIPAPEGNAPEVRKQVPVQLCSVVITTTFCGTHCWPDCPFEDVAYLKDKHRHTFTIKGWKQVRHENRDEEIIRLKTKVFEILHGLFPDGDLGTRSCEELAALVGELFGFWQVEVLEDGENGALVVF